MTAKVVDGQAYSKKLLSRVTDAVDDLAGRTGSRPCLAVFRVGNDPASEIYVRNKIRTAKNCGIVSRETVLNSDISGKDLIAEISPHSSDPDCHGILVQLPLPSQLDEAEIVNSIDPAKDVDGLHFFNVGLLWSGQKSLLPCTPLGCILLLRDALGDLSGMNAVVLGRSNIVGKPIANLLLGQHCTVTLAHSRTRDLPSICRKADILIAAVGRPQLVRGDWIRPGATVIDVGINRIPAPERGEGRTRVVGDVNFDQANCVAGALTPVPGGVGPMTIACLMSNTVTAYCHLRGLEVPEGIAL